MTLSEIAKEAGFYDSARLVNAFTSVYGMSPKKYREARRERAYSLHSITSKRWEWLLENE
jgi:AraC-like DNA-binding protein